MLANTDTFFQNLTRIVNVYLIPLAFTLALFYFFWGVAKYIKEEGQGKEEGRQIMVWGVIALFVISSVWGLVRFIRGEFNINQNQSIEIPTIGGGSSGGVNYSGGTPCGFTVANPCP